MHRATGGSKILSEMWLAEPQWAHTIGKRLVRGRDGTSSHLQLGVSAGPCPPGQARWMRPHCRTLTCDWYVLLTLTWYYRPVESQRRDQQPGAGEQSPVRAAKVAFCATRCGILLVEPL